MCSVSQEQQSPSLGMKKGAKCVAQVSFKADLGKLHVATAQLASSKNRLPALSAIAAAQEKWPMHLACQPALRVDLALTQLHLEKQNAQRAQMVKK